MFKEWLNENEPMRLVCFILLSFLYIQFINMHAACVYVQTIDARMVLKHEWLFDCYDDDETNSTQTQQREQEATNYATETFLSIRNELKTSSQTHRQKTVPIITILRSPLKHSQFRMRTYHFKLKWKHFFPLFLYAIYYACARRFVNKSTSSSHQRYLKKV